MMFKLPPKPENSVEPQAMQGDSNFKCQALGNMV